MRGAERYRQYSSYDYSQVGLLLPLDTFFDGNFPKTTFPTPYDLSLDQHRQRETVYGLVRLNLADPFKVMLGGNYTHAQSNGTSYGEATDFDRTRFLPFVGATYDLTSNDQRLCELCDDLQSADRIRCQQPPARADHRRQSGGGAEGRVVRRPLQRQRRRLPGASEQHRAGRRLPQRPADL